MTDLEDGSRGDLLGVSDVWKARFPGAHVGFLIVEGVSNEQRSEALDVRRKELETALRSRFAGHDRAALLEVPTLKASQTYYRRFDKTYHIQLQLESILFKNKSIPSGEGLVQAMFMAELKNLLLTAGHDLYVLRTPLLLDVAKGTETYALLQGHDQSTKAGDMMISDQDGIISTILYGPDRRTRITPGTRNAVFTVYCPSGIETAAIRRHLEEIMDNIQILAPATHTQLLKIYGAD